MKKVATDYKGKHFIIQDEDTLDVFDILNPYIDAEDVIKHHLESHVEDCHHYGIPAYIGADKELHRRINEIEQKLQ